MVGGEAAFTEADGELVVGERLVVMFGMDGFELGVESVDFTLDLPVPLSPIQTSFAM